MSHKVTPHPTATDCLKSVSSDEEAVSLCQNLKAICQKGGFRLTKWISYSRVVLAAIPQKEMAKEIKEPAHFRGATYAQLHHFCDVTEEGYGTVTYLVQQNSKSQIHSTLVMGKARVAPLKPTTIPCLELTAATMAVRMDRLVRKELELRLTESVLGQCLNKQQQ